MPRYKPVHKGHMLLPVDFGKQIQPGSFEFALRHLIDHELDLSAFHARYRNDFEGASAYDPAVLLKIVLLAYSRGILSSRKIEAACRDNVVFIAASGDSQPNFTTLAAFVSELGDLTAKLFAQVLTVCDRQGLIGREMYAIDGVKLPSNASKAKSGTRADYQLQAEKMEKAAKKMLDKHRAADNAPASDTDGAREACSLERLQREAQQLRDWLKANPKDRQGAKGKARLSNRTDNDSAKPVLSQVEGMATGKGVIQGYTGVAAVDEKHQIVIDAQAHGTGSEQELLIPVVESTAPWRTADAGYHSEANLKQLSESEMDAYIPDNGYRQRDERYAGQEAHKAKPDPLHDKRGTRSKKAIWFTPQDFQFNLDQKTCICPAGKKLYGNGGHCTINGFAAIKFQGAKQDCVPCELRTRCLRTPDKTPTRQVAFFQGKALGRESHTDRMKQKIDSGQGKRMITRNNKRLDRFTLRGRKKVDGQWKLYCLVHNI